MDRRFRHGLQDSILCVFCDQELETIHHLLLGCVFSREIWEACLGRLQLRHWVSVHAEHTLLWWVSSRKQLPKPLRRGFDCLLFLIGWMLWKERNARTFNGKASSPVQLLRLILDEAVLWCASGFKQLRALLPTL